MSPRVPVQTLFGDLRFAVIDEIHAFAGTDRGAHLMSVIERLAALSKHDVLRIGLSATVGNPAQIAGWLAGTSKRPQVVIDPPKPKVERLIKILLRDDERDFAQEASREGRGKESLFFCQSRSLTEAVADQMRGDSIDVYEPRSLQSTNSASPRLLGVALGSDRLPARHGGPAAAACQARG